MAKDFLYIFLNDEETGVAFGDAPTADDAVRARLGDIMILDMRTGELTDRDGTRPTPQAAKLGGMVNIHSDLPPAEEDERVIDAVTKSYEEYQTLVDSGLCPLCKAKTDPFYSSDREFGGEIATIHCSRCGWSDNES